MQHICRSATISGGVEMYGRQFYDFFTSGSADSYSSNHRDAKGSTSRYKFNYTVHGAMILVCHVPHVFGCSCCKLEFTALYSSLHMLKLLWR
jgi:hypothetical protein